MPEDAASPGVSHWEALNFDRAPRRVVSLVPSITESLFELECGHSLVAATDYCVHPADKVAGLPKVGGTKNPALDLIRDAQPDLIIANREENRREDLAALEAEGYKIWITYPRTVRAALDLMWDIVELFRQPLMGQRLTVLESAFEWASLASSNMRPTRVFCPIWRDPPAPAAPRWWMTINHDTYAHDVLRLSGGENIFADRERRYPLAADLGEPEEADPSLAAAGRDTRYPRVTPQEVAELAPDAILLPSEPYAFSEADLSAFDAFPEMPAVANRRVHLVDGSLLTWHGTRLAKVLAGGVTNVLHPAAAASKADGVPPA